MPQQTKADIIRTYLLKYPEMKSAEMVKKIMAEHRGLSVVTQEIANYRRELQEQGKWPPAKQQTAPAPSNREPPQEEVRQEPAAAQPAEVSSKPSLAERLARLKEAAEAVGGIAEAKKILDLLE